MVYRFLCKGLSQCPQCRDLFLLVRRYPPFRRELVWLVLSREAPRVWPQPLAVMKAAVSVRPPEFVPIVVP